MYASGLTVKHILSSAAVSADDIGVILWIHRTVHSERYWTILIKLFDSQAPGRCGSVFKNVTSEYIWYYRVSSWAILAHLWW